MTRRNVPPTLLADFYKISHREQYPDRTEIIYSTWTPRSNKYYPACTEVIAFGFQAFIKKYIIHYFDNHFFNRDLSKVLSEYTRCIKYTLGIENPVTSHLEKLHKLGYMPICIKAIPEGTRVPLRVPMLTIHNTHPDFFWLTNYLETLMSCELWLPSTTATIADRYRKILNEYAIKTVGNTLFVPFQGHDFSMRGMSSVESAMSGGAGHLLSFVGTDNIPAIYFLEQYYSADIEQEIVGTSIPATEHSVMCAGGNDTGDELETYRRLITEIYPNGFISIVSDTWDLWNTITDILPSLKKDIMKRAGKVVIRPDSGDPVKIMCGDTTSFEVRRYKGVVQLLWEIFGGEVNAQGYKVLDPHIGCIYGDAITPERCSEICLLLAQKGFASTNVVYGIGSYTYQYNTRDTFGFAIKSTMCEINGNSKPIYKDPITDDGIKKSQTGVVVVTKDSSGDLICKDGLSFHHNELDELKYIFRDGVLLVDEVLSAIRERLSSNK